MVNPVLGGRVQWIMRRATEVTPFRGCWIVSNGLELCIGPRRSSVFQTPRYCGVRECSPKIGGSNAVGHKSHETGLDVDIRLPLLPPHTNEWFQLKAHNYSKYFHYEAAIVQCETLKKHMDSKYIFFNDPRFIKKRLTSQEANHSEHYHVRIKPPVRIDGVVG